MQFRFDPNLLMTCSRYGPFRWTLPGTGQLDVEVELAGCVRGQAADQHLVRGADKVFAAVRHAAAFIAYLSQGIGQIKGATIGLRLYLRMANEIDRRS